MHSNPFTWDDSVDKFDELTQGYIDPAVASELKSVVKNIENHSTTDLFTILSAIKYPNS